MRAGIALLATMLEPDSLHRALAQNPAAAAALSRRCSGRRSCGWREPDLRERRAAAQAARTRDDAALAERLGEPSRSTGPRRVARIVGPLRVAARPRVAILCSDVVGDGLAGPAIRALESARVLAERCDVQIGVRDATAAIDAPCPVRRLSKRSCASSWPARTRSSCRGPSASGIPRSSPRTCRSRSTSTTR